MQREYGVKAHLHVCHISVPESVELVNSAKSDLKMSCGITPHHATLSTDDMMTPESVIYKVNPPIRDAGMMKKMRELLKAGKIDFIETDHAPHTKQEKEFDPKKSSDGYLSGIPSLNNYSFFIEGLIGSGFSEEQIHRITYSNIKKIFPKIIE